jgi:flagellar basal body P-ring protein FlgI
MFRRGWCARVGAAASLLLGLLGCLHDGQLRLHSEDDSEKDRYAEVKTVGDVTAVGNAQAIQLGGVGLVVGLEGTGGPGPADGYRAMLEDDLRKEGVKNVKEVLASAGNALVVVTALLPPGAGKGDPIDVVVSLPPGSQASSLRGGYLHSCRLFNYEFAGNLSQRPQYAGAQGVLKGHPLARAEGPVLVGVGDGDEAARVRQGRIWGGGRCEAEQPFTLLLNPDQRFARVSSQVADRVNETFPAAFPVGPGGAVATAQNQYGVLLRVPAPYRLNLPRYLRVVRLIPLQGPVDAPAKAGDHRTYRQRLGDDLLDPARTVTAALRLEALGQKSTAVLKHGLESAHPLVRFCAAEALAYLGSPSCGEELARAVAEQPVLRAYGLTALASLDEAVCHVKLHELLATSADDETRYGAFRALRALNEREAEVKGELLNDSFWLHRVAPHAPPLVHVSSTRRAEVVLFGTEQVLRPPFSFEAGEFVVRATEDDQDRCTVSRVPLRGAPSRKQCALAVADVLRTMADMGAMYPEAVALLQQAHACRCLNCRVRCDALPQAVSPEDLVKLGKNKSGKLDEGLELVPGGQDLGLTPTLYDLGLPPQGVTGDGGTAREKSGAGPQPAFDPVLNGL